MYGGELYDDFINKTSVWVETDAGIKVPLVK